MLHSLERNVWQFSAAKTYTQLKNMGDALFDANGKVLPFKDYAVRVGAITRKQLAYLKAEYNLAITGAQMAAKWQQIQAQKAIFPYIQFDAVLDSQTTTLCKSLDGVIKEVDDPFVDIYYPPNHYGCRLTVRQLKRGAVTPADKTPYPIIPDIFKVNLGKRGLAFPEGHAYYNGMPQDVIAESRQFFPYNMQFDILDESDKLEGIIRQHFMVNKNASDYERILAIAKDKAASKVMVDIMPDLNPNKYALNRQIIFPDAKEGKSPDLRINKELVEEEALNVLGKNTLSQVIRNGARQADYVIISLLQEVSDQELIKIANGRFNTSSSLKVIEFRKTNNDILILKNPYKSKAD